MYGSWNTPSANTVLNISTTQSTIHMTQLSFVLNMALKTRICTKVSKNVC